MRERVRFLLRRELYKKVPEIFMVPMQGGMAILTSPSFPSLGPFFQDEFGWGVGKRHRFVYLYLAERKDVVCRAEMKSENA